MQPRSWPFSFSVTNAPRSCASAADSAAWGAYSLPSRTALSTDLRAILSKSSFSFCVSENFASADFALPAAFTKARAP